MMMNGLDITKVFIGVIPDTDEMHLDDIFPPRRREYIADTSDIELKKQRCYGWKLLGECVRECYGIDIGNVNIRQLECGKWVCDSFHFSLTNTERLVAAALSSSNVGIDMQKFEPSRFDTRLARRILTPKELEHYNSLDDTSSRKYANLLWTKKESIFKTMEDSVFVPSRIECDDDSTKSKSILFDREEYLVSVCDGGKTQIEFEENIRQLR